MERLGSVQGEPTDAAFDAGENVRFDHDNANTASPPEKKSPTRAPGLQVR
jgi:hypothetical protein